MKGMNCYIMSKYFIINNSNELDMKKLFHFYLQRSNYYRIHLPVLSQDEKKIFREQDIEQLLLKNSKDVSIDEICNVILCDLESKQICSILENADSFRIQQPSLHLCKLIKDFYSIEAVELFNNINVLGKMNDQSREFFNSLDNKELQNIYFYKNDYLRFHKAVYSDHVSYILGLPKNQISDEYKKYFDNWNINMHYSYKILSGRITYIPDNLLNFFSFSEESFGDYMGYSHMSLYTNNTELFHIDQRCQQIVIYATPEITKELQHTGVNFELIPINQTENTKIDPFISVLKNYDQGSSFEINTDDLSQTIMEFYGYRY